MQREIIDRQNIFEQNGKVMCAGWAKAPLFNYNKEKSLTRRKHRERSCYFIGSDETVLYLSIENSANKITVEIAVADIKKGGVISSCAEKITFFNKNNLSESENGGKLQFENRQLKLQISKAADGKELKCNYIDFGKNKDLYFNIILSELESEGLYELAPFERDRRYFYYKQFTPKYLSRGIIRLGEFEYSLKETNSRAYSDLIRFSKPRKHNYQRLSADCIIDGKRFSLCFASRVGDNRYGNENCFIVNGKITKLSQINVKSTNGRLDRPWYFKGGISAIDICFKPFTVGKEPMAAEMGKTAVIFGKLLGSIKHIDFDEPIIVDNADAHMILTEF